MTRFAFVLAALLLAAAGPFAAAQSGRDGGRPGGHPGGGHPGFSHPGAPHLGPGVGGHPVAPGVSGHPVAPGVSGHPVAPGVSRYPVSPGVSGYRSRTVVTLNPWYFGYPYRYYPYYSAYSYPYSYYGYGYGYDYPSYDYGYPSYGYGYGYPSYGYGYGNPLAPPLQMPADALYGPLAMQRFMGVDPATNPPIRAARPIIDPPAPKQPADSADAPPKPELNQAALSNRYIQMGDTQFAAGKYVTAIERYRRAVSTDPKNASAQFRLAFGFVATEQYDLAARAIRKGLNLDGAWPRSGFRLGELYGGDDRAKDSHLELLAQEAEDHPDKADLLFLIGVFLYTDGQADRAKPFLTRAAQLEPGDKKAIEVFLGE